MRMARVLHSMRADLRVFVFSIIWLLALTFAVQASAQPKLVVQSDEARHAGEFLVPINKSQVLQLDVPFKDLLVGNSEIADVLALTDRSIYVLGKSLGSTSLTIYGREKNLIAVLDLVVSPDIEGLKARLFELMPEETIEVRAVNGAVMLSGGVSSAGRLATTLAIAERYAPGLVTNLLTVAGSQQVMLKVRFAEVSRDVTKRLGFNLLAIDNDIPGAFASGTGASFSVLNGVSSGTLTASSGAFSSIFGGFSAGSLTVDMLFDALEDKNLSKTLAEPNLIAMSGDTASFLAGGEFPIPLAQSGGGTDSNSTITIEFKQFGVGLSFTPTVLDDGLINLVVSPEVSTVTTQRGLGAIEQSGFTVPSLITRRATTTVELRDGQSFAIAGLLQSDFQDAVNQFPGLGDIPVLGALLRSSNFQQNETELVIIVEAHLVKPVAAGTLAMPVDRFIPPTEPDLWLYGRLESPQSGLPRAGDSLSASGAGGISGHYGHIIK